MKNVMTKVTVTEMERDLINWRTINRRNRYEGMKKEKKNWNIFSNKNRIGIESFFIRQTLQNFEFFKVKKQILGEVKMQNYL